MSKRRVVVLGYSIDDDGPEATALRAAGADLQIAPRQGWDRPRTEEDLIAACQGAWAVYGYGPFTRGAFEKLPALRFIQVPSVGYDWVDATAATDHGVAIANNPLFCREEVADHAAMLILASARRLPKQVHRLDAEGWNTRSGYDEMGDTPRVKGSTLGFIAFGGIARLTAEKMRGFGFRYLAYDPYLPAQTIRQHGVEPVSLDDLCRQSDILSMHALLNEETRGMLKEEHFRLMRPTTWVVNTSRGATIHEASLIQALKEGWIGGACLDVVESEPAAADNPLLTMPNVLLTPHTAGYSTQAMIDQRQQSTAEVVRVLGGAWPTALVNPAVKDKGSLW